MNPDEARTEILRLEEERLQLAPEVMGGDKEAAAKDRRLEERIRRLTDSGGHHPDGAIEPGRRDGPR